METICYSLARKELVKTMEKVCNNHAPILVTRKNGQSVVMISLDDFSAIEETVYLLRSPQNALRLQESFQQYANGQLIEKDIAE